MLATTIIASLVALLAGAGAGYLAAHLKEAGGRELEQPQGPKCPHIWEPWEVVREGPIKNYTETVGRYWMQARQCEICGFTQYELTKI